MNAELLYTLALTEVPYIGYVHAKTLMDHYGSAEAIFKASRKSLERLEGIGEARARSITQFRDFSAVEKEIKFITRYGIQCLFLHDELYPQRLLNCYDPPTVLFYKGNTPLNASKIVAIVGTRKATEYGKAATENLVKALASIDCTIVSGLAFGIDAAAHKACIKYDLPTIGVVGHGLDTLYPAVHGQLAKNMLKNGGLLTEFKSGTAPDKFNFPSRNRIVAGISDATIIVESGTKGGSIITAEIAASYHRDVFAVPGRNTDLKSAGCNQLIRENKAALYTDPEQFLETMGWADQKTKTPVLQSVLFADLNAEELKIVDLLKETESLSFDELNFGSGLPYSRLSATLLNLEITGLLKALPGKRFRLCNA